MANGNMTFTRVDNSLELSMYRWTMEHEKAAIRANAVFIMAKLTSTGMKPSEAKAAVEKLFNDGKDQGYSEGNESGYDQGYDAGAATCDRDEFDK